MLDQLFSFARDIKDKEISPLLKRILNLLFVSGIASKIFIVFYFDYQLINLLDYRSYYIFFINGDFFIPLTIFAIIWGGTIFIGYLFFSVPNFILNSKFTARILKFSLIESLSPKKIEDIDSRLDRIGISTISDHGIIALFEQIKSSFSIQDFSKINKNIAIVQANIEGEFVLLVRASIASFIYFHNVQHFGWFLLILVLIISLLMGFVLFLKYQLAGIFPVFIGKAMGEIYKFLIHVAKDSHI